MTLTWGVKAWDTFTPTCGAQGEDHLHSGEENHFHKINSQNHFGEIYLRIFFLAPLSRKKSNKRFWEPRPQNKHMMTLSAGFAIVWTCWSLASGCLNSQWLSPRSRRSCGQPHEYLLSTDQYSTLRFIYPPILFPSRVGTAFSHSKCFQNWNQYSIRYIQVFARIALKWMYTKWAQIKT